MKRRYICTDTTVGILSAIYDAWKYDKDDSEAGIVFWGSIQQEMFCEYLEVAESEKKANSVRRMIRNHLGEETFYSIGCTLLSDEKDKGTAILRTMIEARKIPDGTKIMSYLSHPEVRRVFELSRNVSREMHAWKEFLRFQELENGILYAKISPRNAVLPGIAEHFADRFPLEDFVVYDENHFSYLIHPKRRPWLIVTDEEGRWEIPEIYSEEESQWQKLWKGFKESVTVQERKNMKLQQSNMPLRYRKEMIEFTEKRKTGYNE